MKHRTPFTPSYAGITVNDNVTDSVLPLVSSWFLITVFDTNGPARGSASDQANNRIVVGTSADFSASLSHDADAAGSNKVFEVDVFEIREESNPITGITQATPAVVTSVAHGFANGDKVKISGVVGMVEVNNRIFTIANVAADTFELTNDAAANIASGGFTAYTSDGIVQLTTQTTIHTHRKYAAAGDVGDAGDTFLISCVAGRSLEAHCKNVTDATDITFDHISLSLTRVG